MEIEFQAFDKIPRLKRGVVVTEKIDGTNAQLYIEEDGTIHAGSRTKWVKPGKATDNFGFAAWVEANASTLRLLGIGRHYGEWWGRGIQRGYNLEGKRFSLFNTRRFEETISPENKLLLATIGVSAVPVLAVGDFTDAVVDGALNELRTNGSKAAPGFLKPEGVVVFHSASGRLFKRTLDGDGAKSDTERTVSTAQ